MAIHLGEEADQRVRQLEVARRHDERFWRLANSLRFDSWTEKDLVIQVGQLSVLERGAPPFRTDVAFLATTQNRLHLRWTSQNLSRRSPS